MLLFFLVIYSGLIGFIIYGIYYMRKLKHKHRPINELIKETKELDLSEAQKPMMDFLEQEEKSFKGDK